MMAILPDTGWRFPPNAEDEQHFVISGHAEQHHNGHAADIPGQLLAQQAAH
jgi:hypothetical protein